MNYDIFISYANEDKAFVDAMVHSLEAFNIRCWYAPRDIPTGMEWPAAITDAIKASTLMLLVFSKNSNRSQEVAKELAIASNNNRLVVPVNLDRTAPSAQMEYHLTNKHWLDLYDLETEVAINRVHECLLEYENMFETCKLEHFSVINKEQSRIFTNKKHKFPSFNVTTLTFLLGTGIVGGLLLLAVAFFGDHSSVQSVQEQTTKSPIQQPITGKSSPQIFPEAELAKARQLIEQKSYAKGVTILAKLAQTSNAKAEMLLADLYYSGLGVKVDIGKAAALYQRAANQGEADAQYALACMYEHGDGIEQDIVKAIDLFKKAGSSGHDDSMYSLGNLYEYGAEVPYNLEQAFDWYLKAAKAGNVAAQYKVGIMYYQGTGVLVDQAEGLNWLYKAADAGDEIAKEYLRKR